MAPTQFLADAMLGRLARWLRVLGYDTIHDPALGDRELVLRANAGSRVVLARDRQLLRDLKPSRALEPPVELFTRCLLCNCVLDEMPPDQAAQLVPPRSRDLPGPVRRCPQCRRVYWPGSHARRMRETLRTALPHWLP